MDAVLNAFNNQIVPYLKTNYEYALFAILITAILGIILGLTKTITVFRDFNDLGLVFLFVCAPFFFVPLAGFFNAQQLKKILVYLLLAIEAGIFIFIIIRTFQDNHNPIFWLFALITKIPLSLIFILNVLTLINPSGKTGAKRSSSRAGSLTGLLFLMPLVMGLVRERKGFFNPERIVATRRIY